MWYLVLFFFALLADQVTKLLVSYYAGGQANVTVLTLVDNFLEITYCENRDGMMGIFNNLISREYIFLISTGAILLGLFIYLGVSKNRGKWRNTTMTLILAGAFGNLIDRIIHFTDGAFVRDMIHVIIDIGGKEYFPYIFNVADMALVIGAIMLLLDLMFIDKDAIFRFKKKDKKTEVKEELQEEAK